MTTFVRVRLENGSEASVSAAFAKSRELTPLDKPAARGGKALPAKHNPLKPAAPADGEPDPSAPGDFDLVVEPMSDGDVPNPISPFAPAGADDTEENQR